MADSRSISRYFSASLNMEEGAAPTKQQNGYQGGGAGMEAQDKHIKSSSGKHKLSEKKLRKLQDVYNKRGIIYISRIPPHLKPQKLRHMLSQHGEIGRLYLAPEDPMLRKKRKKEGKNTGKNFTEGWVEFEDKKVAKQVVEMLNGQPMGGKRRSAYFYDLWCMKYLPKFKWDHLTEEINYQKAVREQKLAAEISAAKRERDFYLSRVDKSKAVTAMMQRKRKRAEGEGGAGPASAGGGEQGAEPGAPQQPQSRQQQEQQPAAKKAKQPQQDQGQEGRPGRPAEGRGEPERAGEGTKGAEGATRAALPAGAKVLRHYGQRKAKPDSVTDADAPVLSEGVLRLIAGQKKQARAGRQGE